MVVANRLGMVRAAGRVLVAVTMVAGFVVVPSLSSERAVNAATPGGWTAFVANWNDATATPLDVTTKTAGAPVNVQQSPDGVALTPDAATAFVANFGSASVTPIDVGTNAPGTNTPPARPPKGWPSRRMAPPPSSPATASAR